MKNKEVIRLMLSSKVSDHVFIGGYRARGGSEFDHVLCLLTQWEYDTFDIPPVPGERETHILLDDSHTVPNLDDVVRRGVDVIEACVSKGETILVHCFAGKSRSATVVLAWMMKSRGLSFEEALSELRGIRPGVQPNATLATYLRSLQWNK